MREWTRDEALAWLVDHVNLEAGLPERLAAPTLDQAAVHEATLGSRVTG